MKTALHLILAAALFAAGAQAQRSLQAGHSAGLIAFNNVSVVDVKGGRLIRGQTVVVKNGRIAALGSRKDVPIPAGAAIIDGNGKYLIPGLADMHVHLYTEGDIQTYIANGVTMVRNMAGDSTHLDFRRRIAAGELIGPRIFTAGPVVETGSLSHPDNVLLTDAGSAWREVERQHKAGYDFIKVYNELSPEVYKAVVAAAKKFNMTVAGHVPFEVGLDNALSHRQSSIEHLQGYIQELIPKTAPVQPSKLFRDSNVAWNYVDISRNKGLAERTAASGVWNCPTLVFFVHELSPAAVHAGFLKRPEVKLLSLRGMPDRTKNEGYLAGFTDSDFADTQRGLANQLRLLRALDAAGARLLVGTDSWLAGYAFADELEILVRGGFTPARVLRMATIDAATFLGEEQQSGSIEPGRRADLVLLDGDPLRNISNVRRVRAVVADGRLLQRNDLDALLEKLRDTQNQLKSKL